MPETKTISLVQIAERLGAELLGDGARMVHDVATLAAADASCLSWLGHEKYLPLLAKTQAAGVLVPTQIEPPAETAHCPALLRVADPDLALCDVLEMLAPPVPRVPAGAHPSAVIADDAEIAGAAIGPLCTVGHGAAIGAGTQLHAGVHVGPQVRIGRDCVLWPGVVVRERVQIGDRVIIHPNATIGADGFGYVMHEGRYRHVPQIGTVVIEDDVEIGANTTIDRARSGCTRIGRGTKIDNLVQIAHNCDIGENCVIAGQAGLSGSVVLERYAVLAGQVGIADHIRVGEKAQLGAQAGVQKDVPPGAVYRGTPAADFAKRTRELVALRRLPKLAEQVRDLLKRVAELESATDDTQRS